MGGRVTQKAPSGKTLAARTETTTMRSYLSSPNPITFFPMFRRRGDMKAFRFMSFALLLLLVAGSVLAQEQTASVSGVVTDESGGVVPGVTVEAVNAKGQRFSAVT